jgi:hypothetical protein
MKKLSSAFKIKCKPADGPFKNSGHLWLSGDTMTFKVRRYGELYIGHYYITNSYSYFSDRVRVCRWVDESKS